jgi:hypothetical protein
MLPYIEPGYAVFLTGGTGSFGAVRQVAPAGRPELVVNVEGGGDFRVPLDAVEEVVTKKVLVRWDRLSDELQRAIEHALDEEDFPPVGEGEVEVVPPFGDDEAEAEP